MAAFNTVTAQASCPICRRPGTFDVQFKYGDTWQHHYTVGEQLKWSGTKADVGSPGHRKVLVAGVGGPCPYCGNPHLQFCVVVESDRIVSLNPVVRDPVPFGPDDFLVVDP